MMNENDEKKTGCEFDSSRRKFLATCLRYAACVAVLDSFAFLTNCSSSPKEKPAEGLPKKKTSSANQKLVAISKKGNPYDLTRRAVEALGGMKVFVKSGESVMLLPNIAWDRSPEMAACTHPDVVRAVIDMCKDAGAKEIGVFCHTCHPAQSTYKKSGIGDMAEKNGAKLWYVSPGKDFENVKVNGKTVKSARVFRELLKSDRFINIPIAKVHSLSSLTMCMKNLMGAVEDRQTLHPIIHQGLPDLYTVLKPDLNVLDASRILVRNGPTGGSLADVQKPETVIAGANMVSVDSMGAGLFEMEPSSLKYLVNAQSMGLGEYSRELLEIKEA